MDSSCGVYLITNRVDGKSYVGASVNIQTRWRVHLCELRAGTHCNQKLQRAWNKHGEASFEFTVVEACPRSQIVAFEQKWIDQLNAVESGYNILPFSRSTQGRVFTAEAREKLRQAAHKTWNDPEKRRKMSTRIKEAQNRPEVAQLKRDQAKRQWAQGNIGR